MDNIVNDLKESLQIEQDNYVRLKRAYVRLLKSQTIDSAEKLKLITENERLSTSKPAK